MSELSRSGFAAALRRYLADMTTEVDALGSLVQSAALDIKTTVDCLVPPGGARGGHGAAASPLSAVVALVAVLLGLLLGAWGCRGASKTGTGFARFGAAPSVTIRWRTKSD